MGGGAVDRYVEGGYQPGDPPCRRSGFLAAARPGDLRVPNGTGRRPRARCRNGGRDPEGSRVRPDSGASACFQRRTRCRLLRLTGTGDPRMIARRAELGERTSLTVRLHQAIALLDRFPPSILQLMFRVAIAAVFLRSGLM